jgi:hypothetical protein
MGCSLCWLGFASRREKKGAQSSGPFLGSQALISRSRYPQKLWITLWVAASRMREMTVKKAKPLHWSNNKHAINLSLIN